MERKTGPVGGASAVLAARWTRRGRSARRRTSAAHLTKGRAISGSSAQRIGSVSGEALVMLARRHEERRAGLLGVVEHAHGIAQTRRHMDVDRGEAPAAWA